ncbi:hypothetical protein FKM82_014204 [Ascaphus truei]
MICSLQAWTSRVFACGEKADQSLQLCPGEGDSSIWGETWGLIFRILLLPSAQSLCTTYPLGFSPSQGHSMKVCLSSQTIGGLKFGFLPKCYC